MKLEYKDTSKENWFLITWDLSNKCNYRCSYCPEQFHNGSSGWPDINIVKNFVKEINKVLPNKEICFRISGGEPTHWKDFINFAQTVKSYNNYFTFLTNGSKSIDYFKKINSCIDGLIISYHPQYADINHFIEIKNNLDCPLAVNLMLSPDNFLDMVSIAKVLYNNDIAVWPKIILDKTNNINSITNIPLNYSNEHYEFIKNWPYFRKLNDSKIHRGEILLNGKEVTANDLIINGLNSHIGWQCWAGIDMINVDFWGNIYRANCEQGGIIGTIQSFNLPDSTLVCNKTFCNCLSDIYLRKEL